MGSRPEPDLEAVDELCRMAVAARRLGCRVVLVDVEPALREVLEISGVDDLLTEAPAGSDLPWPS